MHNQLTLVLGRRFLQTINCFTLLFHILLPTKADLGVSQGRADVQKV